MVLHKSAEFRGIFLLKIEKIRGITRNLSFLSDGFQRIPRNTADSAVFRGICQKKLKDSAELRGFVESFFFKIIFDKFRVRTRIDRILSDFIRFFELCFLKIIFDKFRVRTRIDRILSDFIGFYQIF